MSLNSITFWTHSLGIAGVMKDSQNMTLDTEEVEKVEVVGLFSIASIMNHSCQPNVFVGRPFRSQSVEFIAKESIMAGDELFRQYYDNEDRKTRRTELYEQYYFWCNCSRCHQEKYVQTSN